MKNLAGDKTANTHIQEELFLAGIPAFEVEDSQGEVPYSFIGKIGNWTFKRAWTYWIAYVPDDAAGMPLKEAVELHNQKYPIGVDIKNMGSVVRAGGHCACPSPLEYGAYPLYDDSFKEECVKIGKDPLYLTRGEISELCNSGEIKLERYVDHYHVDDLIGLRELATLIKSLQ